jgi:hypothetical protein
VRERGGRERGQQPRRHRNPGQAAAIAHRRKVYASPTVLPQLTFVNMDAGVDICQ